MKHLALSILLVPVLSYGSTFTFSYGTTSYATANGLWYQRESPNKVTSMVPNLSLGVIEPIFERGRYGADFKVSYTYFGEAYASCHCYSDDAYRSNPRSPKASFVGSGFAHGVLVGVSPYYWKNGFKFSLETGVSLIQNTWNETVSGKSAWGSPVDISISARRNINVNPYIGVSVGKKNWDFSVKFYLNKKSPQAFPPLWANIFVTELTYKF